MQYDIATNTDTAVATISGLDDLAPASGLGAPSVPEQASIILLSSVLGGCALAARRRVARR